MASRLTSPNVQWKWCLLFAAFLFPLLTASLQPGWGDSAQMLNAAANLLKSGRPSVTPLAHYGYLPQGPDGLHYSKYSILPILLCVPGVLMAQALSSIERDPLALPLFSIPLGIVAALGLLGLIALSEQLGHSRKTTIKWCLLAFFASPWCVYTRWFYGESLQTGLYLWTLWAGCKLTSQPQSRRWGLAFGLLLGCLPCTKPVFIPTCLALFLLALRDLRGSAPRATIALTIVAGSLPGVILFAAYNQIRSGRWWEMGYDQSIDARGFCVPVAIGLWGLFLSSGKSLFLYSPGHLYGLSRWRQYRLGQPLFGLLTYPALVYIGFISAWWCWSGDSAWGPRLILPVLPILLLPALKAFESDRLFSLILGLGLAVNSLGVFIHPAPYIDYLGRLLPVSASGPELYETHFVPAFSPILGHAWALLTVLGMNPSRHYPWSYLGVTKWTPAATEFGIDLWCHRDPVYMLLGGFLGIVCFLLVGRAWKLGAEH